MPTQKYLKECFSYNKTDGLLTWIDRPQKHFKTKQAWKAFNSNFSGTIAGCVSKRGYRVLTMDCKRHYAHRLIYIFCNGSLSNQVDHIDGVRDNNKLSNLRDVGSIDNLKNKRINHNNKSGIPGVRRVSNCFTVSIGATKNGYIGTFNDFFEACCARKSAENSHSYHKNHGRV